MGVGRMKGCSGVLCCKDMYPLEPKYWCEDCLDNYFAEAEMKAEGDR
jgi:hypothetical protein